MFKDKPQSALKTFIVRIKGNKSSTRAIRVDYHSIIVKHFLISQADLVERKLTQEITFAWNGPEDDFTKLLENWKRDYSNYPIDYDYVINSQNEKSERQQKQSTNQNDRFDESYDSYKKYYEKMYSHNKLTSLQSNQIGFDSEQTDYKKRKQRPKQKNLRHTPNYSQIQYFMPIKNNYSFTDSTPYTDHPTPYTSPPVLNTNYSTPYTSHPTINTSNPNSTPTKPTNTNKQKLLQLIKKHKQKNKNQSINSSSQICAQQRVNSNNNVRERSRQKYRNDKRNQTNKSNECKQEIGDSLIFDISEIVATLIDSPSQFILIKSPKKSGKSFALSFLNQYFSTQSQLKTIVNQPMPLLPILVSQSRIHKNPQFLNRYKYHMNKYTVINLNIGIHLINISQILPIMKPNQELDSHLQKILANNLLKYLQKLYHQQLPEIVCQLPQLQLTSIWRQLIIFLETLFKKKQMKIIVLVDDFDRLLINYMMIAHELGTKNLLQQVILLREVINGLFEMLSCSTNQEFIYKVVVCSVYETRGVCKGRYQECQNIEFNEIQLKKFINRIRNYANFGQIWKFLTNVCGGYYPYKGNEQHKVYSIGYLIKYIHKLRQNSPQNLKYQLLKISYFHNHYVADNQQLISLLSISLTKSISIGSIIKILNQDYLHQEFDGLPIKELEYQLTSIIKQNNQLSQSCLVGLLIDCGLLTVRLRDGGCFISQIQFPNLCAKLGYQQICEQLLKGSETQDTYKDLCSSIEQSCLNYQLRKFLNFFIHSHNFITYINQDTLRILINYKISRYLDLKMTKYCYQQFLWEYNESSGIFSIAYQTKSLQPDQNITIHLYKYQQQPGSPQQLLQRFFNESVQSLKKLKHTIISCIITKNHQEIGFNCASRVFIDISKTIGTNQ